MANNGYGNFLGGFGQGFMQQYGAAQDRKLRNEIAKLQGKLVEAQLKTAEGQEFARKRMQEMMTTGFDLQSDGKRAVPEYSFGPDDEVSEIGGVATPPSNLLDMLVGNHPMSSAFQSAALDSGDLNMGDLLDFKQSQMIQDSVPDFDSLFQSMGELGGPNSPYIPELSIGPNGPTVTYTMNPDYVTTVERGTEQNAVATMYRDVVKAVGLLGELEGSHLQSGNPLAGALRLGGEAGSAFGLPFFSEQDQEALRDKRGELKKLLATFQINSEEREALSQTARGQMVLDLVAQATANLDENGGVPNAKILMNMMEAKLEAANIMGNPVKNEAEIRGYIEQTRKILEDGTLPGAKPAMSNDEIASQITPDMVGKFTGEQLDALLSALDSGMAISAESIAAAKKRWLELNRD